MRSKLPAATAALLGVASVTAAPAGCNADNVLREFRGKAALASSFCSSYTASPATLGQPYPTWIAKSYTTSTSRLSSACSCLTTATATVTSTSKPQTTSSTVSWGSYMPPNPTTTSSISISAANPLPTVTGAPLLLNTAAVSDSIPPAPTKQVYFGNLGSDGSTAVVANVAYKALGDSPLVNLDDLISGLNGFPTCRDDTITLEFIATPNRDLAVSKWANKFILVTSGGNYCGDAGEHNFYKVDSVSPIGASSVTLSVVKSDIKDSLESFDLSYGTFNVNGVAPGIIKRNLEKRDSISAASIWSQIISVLKNGASVSTTTPQFTYSLYESNLFQVNVNGFSGSVGCEDCGISGAVQLFGEVNFDIKNLLATGVIVGFDLIKPTFNLSMSVTWDIEYSNNIEVPLFTIVPWSIEIPKILTILPSASLIAAVDLDIKSAFQVEDLGFHGNWDTLSIGYNLLTKLPTFSGNIIPQISYLTPRFNNGISLYGQQSADVTVWLGPRVGLDVDILSGAASGHADITLQFPAIHVAAEEQSQSECPDASGTDMCVGVFADARIIGTASASADLVGLVDANIEHELFNYNLGTIVNTNFDVKLPL
ncbi:hypothetical protein TWF694_011301 [Orbilia ellipsospora]|uniref:Uncharacterized protein n=1 Tax=Orbilia ellipsospora TaxID=2528407 RepID=A0AAV9X627_9PEZI